jgi:hypothetical protein
MKNSRIQKPQTKQKDGRSDRPPEGFAQREHFKMQSIVGAVYEGVNELG